MLKSSVDGFTYSNSMKIRFSLKAHNHTINFSGWKSVGGAELLSETLRKIPLLLKTKKFLSASGGIITGEDALNCLNRGASSVQICSALYLYGQGRLTEIIDYVKKYSH